MADVLFCSLCDQSVPLAEVDSGVAYRRDNRALCPLCRDLLKESDLKSKKSGHSGVILALVALGVAIAFPIASQRISGLKIINAVNSAETARKALKDDLGVTLDNRFSSAAEGMREEIALLSAKGETLLRQLSDLESLARERFSQVQDDLIRLEAALSEQEALGKRIARSEANLSVFDERQREARRSLGTLRDQVDLLSIEVRESAKRPPSSDVNGDSFTPQIMGLLEQLQSTDDKERLDALDKLSSEANLRLVPHVLPILADPYEFNRFYAAKTLGEWGAKSSVPYLIEALSDEMSFVRQAALQALHYLTAQNFRFDHQVIPSEPKNAAAIASWQDWWVANGKDFLDN